MITKCISHYTSYFLDGYTSVNGNHISYGLLLGSFAAVAASLPITFSSLRYHTLLRPLYIASFSSDRFAACTVTHAAKTQGRKTF